MRSFAVTVIVATAIGCATVAPSPLTYQVTVAFSNHTGDPAQLLVTDDANQRPGIPSGFASPAVIPPFTSLNVQLVVPGQKPWALFVAGPGPLAQLPLLRSENLRGCTAIRLPVTIELSAQGAIHIDIPSDLC